MSKADFSRKDVTEEQAKKLLEYTLVDTPDKCWMWIGRYNVNGYGEIDVWRRRNYAHRIAFALWRGNIPQHLMVDHQCNNKWCVNPNHLRLCDYPQNMSNTKRRTDNTSGVKGVCLDKTRNKFLATLTFRGKHYSIGRFDTLDEAREARERAAEHIMGEFARHE